MKHLDLVTFWSNLPRLRSVSDLHPTRCPVAPGTQGQKRPDLTAQPHPEGPVILVLVLQGFLHLVSPV